MSILSEVIYPTAAVERLPIETQPYLELYCLLELPGLIIALVFNLILILLCAFFGFMTRALPDNFNESRFIFFSVMTTTFLWIMFLPTYFTTFYAYYKTILLAVCLLVNGTLTLVLLFLPKVYAVYFVTDPVGSSSSSSTRSGNSSISVSQSSTFGYSVNKI